MNEVFIFTILAKPYLAKKECIICRKNKTSSKGSGYEEFTKCTTDAAASSIITHVNSTDDTYAKTQLMDYCSGDVIAQEFMYHRSCLREITRPKLNRNEENQEENRTRQQCFELLKKYIEEKIVLEGQFLRMTSIAEYYRQLQKPMKIQVKGDTTRNVKDRLVHELGEKLSIFQKSPRTGEIVYSETDYRDKVFVFGEKKLKRSGGSSKVKLRNFP